jgi:hypothetical protein
VGLAVILVVEGALGDLKLLLDLLFLLVRQLL